MVLNYSISPKTRVTSLFKEKESPGEFGYSSNKGIDGMMNDYNDYLNYSKQFGNQQPWRGQQSQSSSPPQTSDGWKSPLPAPAALQRQDRALDTLHNEMRGPMAGGGYNPSAFMANLQQSVRALNTNPEDTKAALDRQTKNVKADYYGNNFRSWMDNERERLDNKYGEGKSPGSVDPTSQEAIDRQRKQGVFGSKKEPAKFSWTDLSSQSKGEQQSPKFSFSGDTVSKYLLGGS